MCASLGVKRMFRMCVGVDLMTDVLLFNGGVLLPHACQRACLLQSSSFVNDDLPPGTARDEVHAMNC